MKTGEWAAAAVFYAGTILSGSPGPSPGLSHPDHGAWPADACVPADPGRGGGPEKECFFSAEDVAWWVTAHDVGVAHAVGQAGLGPRASRSLAVTIVQEAEHHGLDPRLVVAIIQVESGFDPFAVSEKGALGLMQIMPATGVWLAQAEGQKLRKVTHLMDMELNVALATRYLADLLERFGRLDHALLAYNAGPTAARQILADPQRSERWLAGYPARVLKRLEALRQWRPAAEGT